LLQKYLSDLPSARLSFGVEFENAHQDRDGVTVTVRSEASESRRITTRYVIGADGAHSTTRAAMGIALDGPDDLAEFHRIEFRAPLAPLLGDRRFGLYVITNPAVAGVVAARGRGDRWGLSREWSPNQPRMVDFDDGDLVDLLTTAIGAPTALVLEARSAFSFAAQIAPRYRVGRMFLVGDAAHRMTPRGGTGMNTAIQDAYDLGWRLAWVLRGWATVELLDAYEAVRRPVGLHNVERAGQPDGARRDAEDALPWDLNGRVAHRWISNNGGVASTLDLIADGFTLFAGSAEPRWATTHLETVAPLRRHIFGDENARALGLPVAGARLLGPDARELAAWDDYERFLGAPRAVGWAR